jgi:acetyl esterase/lipase
MPSASRTQEPGAFAVGEAIALWSGLAPGSESWTHVETAEADPVTGEPVVRDVVTPTITPVLPPVTERNGTAVVIAPGGGFMALAWEHEGLAVARWFAARGAAAFLLKYRVGPSPDPEALARWQAHAPRPDGSGALQRYFVTSVRDAAERGIADGQQAVRLVRQRAEEWGIDRSRVGIIGFSAGGTVALHSAVCADEHARPSFVVNVYGAFLEGEVPADAPPCFTVVAADDALCLDWCLDAAEQWRRAGRPIELHVYERGGHGFGVRPQGLPVDSWIDRLGEWLHDRTLLRATP